MAVQLIPTTVSLTVAATFSPPTTCFATVPAATYSLLPDGPDSQVEDRLVIRPFYTQCYPPGMLSLGQTSVQTSTAGSQIVTIPMPTASWFSASSCPTGFASVTGSMDSANSISHIQCCPSGGSFTLESVGIGTFMGCVQTPTAPVTLVNGSSTTTLATPSNEPYGISYRPLEVAFTDNGTTTSSNSDSSTAKSNGLTTAAQAGIGVGVALIVVILVALGVFFWWTRKRKARSQEKGVEASEMSGEGNATHELPPNEIVETGVNRNSAQRYDVDMKEKPQYIPPVELEGSSALHEAPVVERPGELSAGRAY